MLSAAMIAGSVSAAGFFIWVERTLPDPGNLISRAIPQSTKIYDRTGKTVLYDIHGAEKRTLIKLADIPEIIKWSTIAIEDKKFYEHGGFDLRGIARAIFINIAKRGKVQGGSTITQQLIKNSVLSSEKTYTRKFKELILAWKLESKMSKDQILELYLNEIPYGSTSYGIAASAETFFGKKANDLALSEAALLAALPKAPTYFSPYGNHKEELLARSRHVIDEMAAIGKISKEEATEAKADNPILRVLPRREAITAPHFVFYVKEILTEKYGEKLVEQGGLKVITSLDLDKQNAAEEAIAAQVKNNEKQWQAGNAALVAIDPKTGQVLAMVGSKDYFDMENDGNVNVTLRPRQPGSSFKPIVYAASFLRGYTPTTVLFDVNTVFKTEIGKDYEPKNYDLKERGPVTVRQALAGSLNIPAVKMIYLTGVENVLDLADKLGYTTLKERSRFGLSLVLGGGEVKLLEHAAAFGVFAADGIKHTISPILKVEDSSGRVLEEWKDEEVEGVPQDAARQITGILSDNNARAYIFGEQNYLTLPDRPVAAKTGTTNDYRDAWTIGYTPEVVAGVWVGNNNNKEMKLGADGSKIAAPIWNAFMKKILENVAPSAFPEPEIVITGKPILDGEPYSYITLKINKTTGLLADENTPSDQIEEKTYRQVHNVLHYIRRDDPRGSPPANPKDDPQYESWEAAVQRWAAEQGIKTENPILPDDKQNISIKFLQPEGNLEVEKNFNASLEVSSAAPITKIELRLDEKLLMTLVGEPWFTAINLDSSVSAENHILSARAYDENGYFRDEKITIKLKDILATSVLQGTALKWKNPRTSRTIRTSEFPFSVMASVDDPSFGRAELLLDGREEDISLGAAIRESNGTFRWIWGAPPPDGSFNLKIKIYKEGNTYLLEPLMPITINSN